MIRIISLYDLMQDTKIAEIIRGGNEEQFLTVLWGMGFDTSKTLEHQECYHRPETAKDNTPIYGVRILGTERSDAEWKKSGYWSTEARMEQYRDEDPELYKQLQQMSYVANFTGDIIEHMQNKGSLGKSHHAGNEVEENESN